MLAGWIILGIIGIIIWIILILYGYNLCKNNDAIGVVILFIVLNIIGLILGIAILWNNKNIEKGTYLKNYAILEREIKFIKKEKKKKRKKEKDEEVSEKYRKLRLLKKDK